MSDATFSRRERTVHYHPSSLKTAVLTCMCVIYTCMTYVQVHGMCVSQHVLGGQRIVFESLFSSSSVGFRDQTQVVSLCNKHFYRLSHLAGPISYFLESLVGLFFKKENQNADADWWLHQHHIRWLLDLPHSWNFFVVSNCARPLRNTRKMVMDMTIT